MFFYFGDLSWSVVFTSNVLQKLCFFFHNHVSQAAVLSLSFKNDVRYLDIL